MPKDTLNFGVDKNIGICFEWHEIVQEISGFLLQFGVMELKSCTVCWFLGFYATDCSHAYTL
jgi:hypothetical protein